MKRERYTKKTHIYIAIPFKFLAENQAAGDVWCKKCKAYHFPVAAGAIDKQCVKVIYLSPSYN